MEPDLNDRKRLGAQVRQARKRAGYSKTAEWADVVGRSDRMLLGLERGESVGADTYAAVAEALGWPLDRIYAVLNDEPVIDPGQGSIGLAAVSHEELAAELLRRMKAGDGDVGRDAAAIGAQDDPGAEVRSLTRRQEMQQPVKKAARNPEGR